ncbi:MAG: oxidoreductase [Lentisphaerae bacterium GWF2_52_8]|nr:MAG: oxidoreductase [Lentisphaerae bacterium GWF2_52_8]
MRKAIIIGGSSGIGRELAKILVHEEYIVGVTARRIQLLSELQKEIGPNLLVKKMDVSKPEDAVRILHELIDEMGGCELLVISAGTGFINPGLSWDKEEVTISVNVSGFTAVAAAAMLHFIEKGRGHLVNISSIAALRGQRNAPAYNASKAYASNYMQGLRQKAGHLRLPIVLTDIQPGLVDTAMARGERLFWVAAPEKAAQQIFDAIRKKKKHAYVTKRWRLIAWVLRFMPDFLYKHF